MPVAIVKSGLEQWLAARRELITASDAAAILGLDPFRAPADVYASKLGRDVEETEPMRWGKRLESAIAQAYAEATSRPVYIEEPYYIAKHADIPWLGATLDRGILPCEGRSHGALELKASANADAWEDGPPLPYQIQLTIQLACTRRQWGSLAAFLGLFRPVVWYDREYDQELFDLMVPKLEAFRMIVKNQTPPDDPAWYSRASLRALYPQDDGSSIALDEDARLLAEEWEYFRTREAEAREMKESAEDQLRARLGSAQLGYLPDGTSLTLKTVPESEVKTYTRAAYRTLRRFRPKGRR